MLQSLIYLQKLTEYDLLQDELFDILVEGDYQRIMNRLHLSGVLSYVSDPHFIRMYTYMKDALSHPSDFERMRQENEENHHQTCNELSENIISSAKKDINLLYTIQALLGSYEGSEEKEDE